MSHQYRKKPVVIEAFQMTRARRYDNSEWPEWLNRAWNGRRDQVGTLQRVFDRTASDDILSSALLIVTPEGRLHVACGDWIIRGVKGELYPCKQAIFEMTYEPVEAKA